MYVLMLMTVYECNYYYVYILPLIFVIIEFVSIFLNFTKKKLVYKGSL